MELESGFLLLAVADGVGGSRGGEVASAQAIGGLKQYLTAADITDPEEALRSGVMAANEAVRTMAAAQIEIAAMSTTFVGGLVRGETVWVANVGDSRAYVIRDGRAEQVSVDHSWVGEQIRKGLVDPDDPLVKSFSNIVTRVVGPEEDLEVDMFGPVDISDGAAVLFCSDGLHGPVDDEAIAAAFAEQPNSAEAVAERLVQLAIDAGGPDNVSVAIFDTR